MLSETNKAKVTSPRFFVHIQYIMLRWWLEVHRFVSPQNARFSGCRRGQVDGNAAFSCVQREKHCDIPAPVSY